MPADLAILIVTLVRRRQFFARLMRRLEPQLNSRVQVYTLEDSGAEKIGEKRQRMIESVAGPGGSGEPYLCFIDDDDLVSDNYVRSITGALDQQPDVVGFRLKYYEDGKLKGHSMHSVRSKRWSSEMLRDGTARHYRTPNHLNPVKSEMALSVGFKPMQTGEDADYSERLYKKYPQMNEVFVDEYLYIYEYRNPQRRVESEHLPVTGVCA